MNTGGKQSQGKVVREPRVHDCFFNLFVYEMIMMYINKHAKLPQEKQNQANLCLEVEGAGHQLGQRVTDLLDLNSKTKLTDQMEVTKFLAVDVWQFLFQDRIVKMTYKGSTYQLYDDQFRFLARLSTDNPDSKEFKSKLQVFESFIIGIVKGALQNLGNDPPPDVKLLMIDKKENQPYPGLEITIKYTERGTGRRNK